MIKIDFEYETEFGVYRDALWLPEDQIYTPEEIEAMKLERLNNWLSIINPPPSPDQIIIDNGEPV